ncbi:MAG: phytanoyl-CoA dioxygenase family protein [Candidatus Latescibacteria bacterium]|nr:phytanoyl-CoA dioxygenase family protein [Candidatus Latescibacterota bacterium]
MISAEQLRTFEEQGAVTIDTPLTAKEIAAAAAAIDALLPFQAAEPDQAPRFRYGATCNYYEPALLDLIQHPFFEAVAKRVLRADASRFFQTAILASYPQPESEFSYDQHTDIQYSLEDWAATPRRVVCSFFLWLTDVNERRAQPPPSSRRAFGRSAAERRSAGSPGHQNGEPAAGIRRAATGFGTSGTGDRADDVDGPRRINQYRRRAAQGAGYDLYGGGGRNRPTRKSGGDQARLRR